MSGTRVSVWEFPLSGTPQRFSMVLGGVTYQFLFLYREHTMGGWVLNIDDSLGAPLVHGIPLVTGANLLEQYGYLGFSGELWVKSDGDPDAVPSFDGLGNNSHVLWVISQ